MTDNIEAAMKRYCENQPLLQTLERSFQVP